VLRTLPYWEGDIVPALQRGKTVLVAAHGNSIRGMLKHIDGIADDEITEVEIPTGVPLVYHLDKEMQPIRSEHAVAPLSGYFIGDADEIAAAQKQVAEQSAASTDGQLQFLCIGDGCLMLSNGDMKETFDEFDEDGNGLITHAELKRAIERIGDEDVADADVDAMIRSVDRNGDGQIDFNEFVQALTAERA